MSLFNEERQQYLLFEKSKDSTKKKYFQRRRLACISDSDKKGLFHQLIPSRDFFSTLKTNSVSKFKSYLENLTLPNSFCTCKQARLFILKVNLGFSKTFFIE